MAKYPAAGRVKTRLAAVLGAERAAQLYRAFVLDLAERLALLPLPVVWGTATVLETTLARARALALRTHLLPQAFDVDDVDDLRALRALLAGGAVRLPRTAALLATFDGDGA